MTGPQLLTVGQAADLLGVSPRTLRRRLDARQLPCFRDGGVLRIPSAALAQYVKRHVIVTPEPSAMLRKSPRQAPSASGAPFTSRPRLWDVPTDGRA